MQQISNRQQDIECNAIRSMKNTAAKIVASEKPIRNYSAVSRFALDLLAAKGDAKAVQEIENRRLAVYKSCRS